MVTSRGAIRRQEPPVVPAAMLLNELPATPISQPLRGG
jgi:hypothetical protein